jgi:hypothetical protein
MHRRRMQRPKAHGLTGYAANPVERTGQMLQLRPWGDSLPMHSDAVADFGPPFPLITASNTWHGFILQHDSGNLRVLSSSLRLVP